MAISFEDDNKNSKEMYQKIGFGIILRIYTFFGFRISLDENDGNKWNFSKLFRRILMAMGLLVATASFLIGLNGFYATHRFYFKDGKMILPIELVCGYFSGGLLHLNIYMQYLLIWFTFGKVRSKLRRMSQIVNNLFQQIPDKKSFVKRCKIRSLVICFILIVYSLSTSVMVLYSMEVAIMQLGEQLKESDKIVARIMGIIMALWLIFVVSFCLCHSLCLLFFCSFIINLNNIIFPSQNNNYFGPISPEILEKHRRHHRLMGKLVQDLNDIYSNFLFYTLLIEFGLIILYTRIIDSFLSLFNFAIPVIIGMTQLVAFVLKNLFCSALNHKVLANLSPPCRPKSLNEMQNQSEKRIKASLEYILYLKAFTANTVQMTYGGFFVVDKNFIITVAGTIFSYILFLNRIK